jgi:hypothetical protein
MLALTQLLAIAANPDVRFFAPMVATTDVILASSVGCAKVVMWRRQEAWDRVCGGPAASARGFPFSRSPPFISAQDGG